ncbi:hypothetical protein B0H11DRAFT_1919651 [Mycena galericulata]|nr:hypothetical protein B0H11DRAFT_1919651 [Mycena galericulata]
MESSSARRMRRAINGHDNVGEEMLHNSPGFPKGLDEGAQRREDGEAAKRGASPRRARGAARCARTEWAGLRRRGRHRQGGSWFDLSNWPGWMSTEKDAASSAPPEWRPKATVHYRDIPAVTQQQSAAVERHSSGTLAVVERYSSGTWRQSSGEDLRLRAMSHALIGVEDKYLGRPKWM